MSDKDFKKIQIYTILAVVAYEIFHLSLEHFNGGVVSHHLLHEEDLPSISNLWGILILPFLTWFSFTRIKKRISIQTSSLPALEKIPKVVFMGFFGMLVVSIIQSIFFETGYQNFTMYLAAVVLFTGLFIPIYRVEYILGHVLGSSFIFGPVIPLIGILVMGLISAISNLIVKPLILRLLGRKVIENE